MQKTAQNGLSRQKLRAVRGAQNNAAASFRCRRARCVKSPDSTARPGRSQHIASRAPPKTLSKPLGKTPRDWVKVLLLIGISISSNLVGDPGTQKEATLEDPQAPERQARSFRFRRSAVRRIARARRTGRQFRLSTAYPVAGCPSGIRPHPDEEGCSASADVVTPTALNAASIELHFRRAVDQCAERDEAVVSKRLQMIARVFAPCISCSVHLVRKS